MRGKSFDKASMYSSLCKKGFEGITNHVIHGMFIDASECNAIVSITIPGNNTVITLDACRSNIHTQWYFK
jgi:hypothetical protein